MIKDHVSDRLLEPVLTRLREKRRVIRIVCMGSSNTERRLTNGNTQNWVDWLDLGLSWGYGRFHIMINSGISGQTSHQMLARFDPDVELFQPHLLFITTGGNDCNPAKKVSLKDYKDNLKTMLERSRAIGCQPVLQTYYSADIEDLLRTPSDEYDHPTIAAAFPLYMQAVREVAGACECPVIDHLRRWEPLRTTRYDVYRTLMMDLFHMNALGNTVFALDILRRLGVTPIGDWQTHCAEALRIQKWMDENEPERLMR